MARSIIAANPLDFAGFFGKILEKQSLQLERTRAQDQMGFEKTGSWRCGSSDPLVRTNTWDEDDMVRSAGNGNSERQARLQRELRANLKRRKEQAKARRERSTLIEDKAEDTEAGDEGRNAGSPGSDIAES